MICSARTAITTAGLVAGAAAAVGLAVSAPAQAGEVHRAAGELLALTAATTTTVPAGAAARVQYVETGDGRTRVTLHVTGLAPDRTYGAHAHVSHCSDNEGGVHFRVGSAVTAQTEIWLDVRTNDAGNGHSSAVQDWQVPRGSGPLSVVLHANPTNPGPADAGKAGPKLACLPAEF